ncbi:FKBP-type peptidyl-prolyl cis-trans isomerase [Nafulsella turpanensis]|uniref:FKBP-type peptidyl-prolyl cis-trans isomerase n=1 Tax=Nafulsella turpanensis TaxID=1265690 RepID=UPI0006856D4A|nr:FKBP-type peptidyl-prolyl cis-trans isomerase [Nafulsella turpanensis]
MSTFKNFLLLSFLGAVSLQACNDKDGVGEVQTTESGLQYVYLERGEEVAPDSNQILTLHMVYTTADDSVIFDSREQDMPLGLKVNDPNMKGMLAEGLNMLHVGDSVKFIVPAQDFYFQTARMPVPAGIEPTDSLIFNIGVQEALSEEAFRERQMEEYKKQQELAIAQQQEQLATDVSAIEAFLAENNIEAEKTESGLYYNITEKGNGPEIDAGDKVTVHYKGMLLDGTVFDSSYDRGEPFSLNVGQGMVIRGWDEALQLLREGSEATLYIPSPLGYGARGAGNAIAPNSILVFEVEVLDVEE